MNHLHRTRRGFGLVEMLFLIAVGGVAMIIAGRLLGATGRAYRETANATNALRAQQQWLAMLRADAWAASQVEAGDAATFSLAGGAARWTWNDATLVRTAGDDVRRWPVATAIRWRWDDAALAAIGDGEVPLATPSVQTQEAK